MTPLEALGGARFAHGARRPWATSHGPLWIESHATVQIVDQLAPDSGIGIFSHYVAQAPIRQKEVVRRCATNPQGNAVIAYTPAGSLVGYVLLVPPGTDERWGGAQFPFVYEFGLMEVSRNWRSVGLADRLMQAAFGVGELEQKIVVSTSYAWHWDLQETGLSKWQYRVVLRRLLLRHGFEELFTDEENIRFDAANLFAVRIGSLVTPDQEARFKRVLLRSVL